MAERYRVIEAVTSVINKSFRLVDTRPDPTFPLSSRQRARTERGSERIIRKVGFGPERFNKFVNNMTLLTGDELSRNNGGGFGSLKDPETGVVAVSFFSGYEEEGVIKSAAIIFAEEHEGPREILIYEKQDNGGIIPISRVFDGTNVTTALVSDADMKKGCNKAYKSYSRSRLQAYLVTVTS